MSFGKSKSKSCIVHQDIDFLQFAAQFGMRNCFPSAVLFSFKEVVNHLGIVFTILSTDSGLLTSNSQICHLSMSIRLRASGRKKSYM